MRNSTVVLEIRNFGHIQSASKIIVYFEPLGYFQNFLNQCVLTQN